MTNPFSVSMVCWHDGEPLLKSVREAVFIHEQGIPAELVLIQKPPKFPAQAIGQLFRRWEFG